MREWSRALGGLPEEHRWNVCLPSASTFALFLSDLDAPGIVGVMVRAAWKDRFSEERQRLIGEDRAALRAAILEVFHA